MLVPIGFVSDHMEVIYDLDTEAMATAEKVNLPAVRAATPAGDRYDLFATPEPVIGPADVTVTEGTHTIVYAWGSLADNNLQLAVQTIEGLHSAPGSVPGALDGSTVGAASAAARHRSV